MHAAPVWLPLALGVAAAVLIWAAIYEKSIQRRRLSLFSILLLLTLLAVAFAAGRLWLWERGRIEVVPAIENR